MAPQLSYRNIKISPKKNHFQQRQYPQKNFIKIQQKSIGYKQQKSSKIFNKNSNKNTKIQHPIQF